MNILPKKLETSKAISVKSTTLEEVGLISSSLREHISRIGIAQKTTAQVQIKDDTICCHFHFLSGHIHLSFSGKVSSEQALRVAWQTVFLTKKEVEFSFMHGMSLHLSPSSSFSEFLNMLDRLTKMTHF